MNSLISPRRFFVFFEIPWDILYRKSCLCNRDTFISSFLIFMLLFHFLTLLHWIDLLVLCGIRVWEWIPLSCSEFKVKASAFHPKYNISFGRFFFFFKCSLSGWGNFVSIFFLRGFVMNEYWIVKCLFWIYWYNPGIFLLGICKAPFGDGIKSFLYTVEFYLLIFY